MKILLVDDDEHVAELLKAILTEQHYVVDVATDGYEGWELVESFTYDVVILDVMLPKLDGISFCRRLRSQGNQVPVVLLTARDTSSDKVMGLDAGADDYLVKPVDLKEFIARIRALSRRGAAVASPVLKWGSLRLDLNSYEVTYDSYPIHLSPKEFSLMELFLRNSQRVFSRSAILEQLWALDDDPPGEDTVKAHIKGLRNRFKKVSAADLIETVYGLGYRLNPIYFKEQAKEQVKEPTKDQAKALTSSISVTPNSQAAEHPSSEQQEREKQQKQAKTRAAIAQIWESAKPTIFQRVELLEQATQQVIHHQLDETLRQQAERDAHKLAGSLGTFGIATGSQVARQVEALFQFVEPLTQSQIEVLQSSVVELRQLVEARAQSASSDQAGESALVETPTPNPITQPITHTQARILVVDDDPLVLSALRSLLVPWGLQVTTLEQPEQIWHFLKTTNPDLLVLDITMPGINGIELCQSLRRDSRWGWLPIVFLTAKTEAETIQQVFMAGADDYVSKPINAVELSTRILNRLERSRRLRHQTHTDTLTGIANQQKSTEDLEQLLRLAKRFQQPLSLAVLKLDHLQQANRQYGYSFGDRMLRQVGQLLRQKLRSEDVVARWGGAEFVVGMYGITRQDGVEALAESLEALRQIHSSLPNQTLPDQTLPDQTLPDQTLPDQTPPSLTFSAGVAQYPADAIELPELYQIAGITQTQAEKLGGDRVIPAGWHPAQTSPLPLVDVALVHPSATVAAPVLQALETRGYHSQWLQDERTALERLGGISPRLRAKVILLAEDSPTLNGMSVLKRLKRDKVLQHSQVIVLLSQPGDAEAALKLGAADYIIMPYSASVLMQRLRQIWS